MADVDAGADAGADTCVHHSTYNGSFGLRVGGLFIILAASLRIHGNFDTPNCLADHMLPLDLNSRHTLPHFRKTSAPSGDTSDHIRVLPVLRFGSVGGLPLVLSYA
jgi:hypothetical protein